jgi:lipoprotein NlpI
LNQKIITCISSGVIALQLTTTGAEPSKSLIQQAKEAYSHREPVKALELATRAAQEDPANATNFYVRAQILGLIGKSAEAVTNYSAAINRDVLFANAYQARAIEQFKLGQIKESIEDFDRYVAVEPRQEPYQWMRGIALYEAKRFADGQKQFESHQTVNGNDVENAAWHFACVARKSGSEAARKQLLPIKADSRVPLMTVYALYGGTATIDDVFKAVEEGSPTQDDIRSRLFYGNFYVGLYLEALRDERALVYLRKAAETYRMDGPMGDVARVHYKRIMEKGS